MAGSSDLPVPLGMEQARQAVASCPLLCCLPRDKLQRALGSFSLLSFPPGARLASALAPSEGLFVVLSGVALVCPRPAPGSWPPGDPIPVPGSPTLRGAIEGFPLPPAVPNGDGDGEASALEYSLDDDLGSAASVAESGGSDPRNNAPSPHGPESSHEEAGAAAGGQGSARRGRDLLPEPYMLKAGDWFGHPPSSSPAPLSPADVFATSPVVCAFFKQPREGEGARTRGLQRLCGRSDEGSGESDGGRKASAWAAAGDGPALGLVGPVGVVVGFRLVSSAGELDALLAGKLEGILHLEELRDGQDAFLGVTPREMFSFTRIFGGQLLGQALMAATRTVEAPLLVHSLHAYFLRPGDTGAPVLYRVERIRDGTAFSARRVKGYQGGKEVFLLTASFQKPEAGLSFRAGPPAGVPPPEELLMVEEEEWRMRCTAALPVAMRRRLARGPVKPMPVELRHCESVEKLAVAQLLREYPQHPALDKGRPETCQPGTGAAPLGGFPSQLNAWIKARGVSPSSNDLRLHRCIIAFFSDFVLLGSVLAPHGLFPANPRRINMASLDHAMWFHEECRADTWLLYNLTSPWTGHARGFALGRMFTREGMLVVSTAQEGLVRLTGQAQQNPKLSRL